MRNYVETFEWNRTYNEVCKALLKYHSAENKFLWWLFSSANNMKTRQAWCHVF